MWVIGDAMAHSHRGVSFSQDKGSVPAWPTIYLSIPYGKPS